MDDPRGRPHVLHVVDALRPHGMQLGLIELIERSRDAIDSSVLCLRDPGECAERLSGAGVPVHCLRRRDRHEWTLSGRIFGFMRHRRVDVIHTRNWGAIDALPAAILARVPVRIHSEHGSGLSELGPVARRRSRARRWLAPFVTCFVVVSDALGRWLATEVGIPQAKIRVLPNGVDPQHFLPATDRSAVRSQFGYGSDEVVVGTVGRLDAVKQFQILIEAVAQLYACDRRIRLAIVGEGPERAILEAAVRHFGLSGVVRLPGHQADVRPWLQAMDVFALPSAREGISRALLEAMATALPVVASAVPGNGEVVHHSGIGVLVPPGDAATLSAALQLYCSDPQLRGRLGMAARQRVITAYSMDSLVQAYVRLYRGGA